MNDKPFDPTKPVQTRDGRKAEIVRTNYSLPHAKEYTILALVEYKDSMNEYIAHYLPHGGRSHKSKNGDDLVNITTKKEGWVNIYPEMSSDDTIFVSVKDADRCARYDRIACVRIEWEE